MKDIYNIENPSQETLIKILKEIPQEPRNGYITFLADGLKISSSCHENIPKYQEECSKRKIIPDSIAIIHPHQGDTTISFNDSWNGLEKLFNGYRINKYKFHLFPLTYHAPHQKDWGTKLYKIKDSIMPTLLKNNYEISEFLFCLGYRKGFKGNSYPNIIIDFNSQEIGFGINPSKEKIIRLLIDNDYEKKDNELFKKMEEFLFQVSSENQ
jgi:hypothetical protein